ncbi:MAG: NusG domain II-containing protein [Bacilli bacterium]|nr:NusG domain II-containing protein [Bacilli bacterium]MDD4809138.1 NusG domain II-containing protein [Bacilli bacterium]
MNKKDIKLILLITIISILIIIGYRIFEIKGSKNALVYYEDDLVLKLDLSLKDEQIYYVDGYNGKVKIMTKDGKVKVDSENSPLHLCSKQGYISRSYETIVCLPNKVIIKIDNQDDLDAIVK